MASLLRIRAVPGVSVINQVCGMSCHTLVVDNGILPQGCDSIHAVVYARRV